MPSTVATGISDRPYTGKRLPRRFVSDTLSLRERLSITSQEAATPGDRVRAESDLKRFFAAENEAALDQFLNVMGITVDDLLGALAVRSFDSRMIENAAWYQMLGTVLSSSFIGASNSAILGAEGLRKPLYPFLSWADAQINEWCTIHDASWDSLRQSLLRQVSDLLYGLTYRAFILEVNILRVCSGDNANREQRLAIDQFAQTATNHRRYIQRLYLTYPALTRLMATAMLRWRQNTEDLLVRLRDDTEKIERLILGQPLGLLHSINGTLSDPHDGGKRVLILRFSNGQRVVYKPRRIEADVGYWRFIDWLNGTGITPQLRVLRVVPGSDYGWVEFVDAAPLPVENKALEFYLRHGIHLAVLYLMKATDFHSENIIASGEHPILVDLETLMHADAKFATEVYPRTCGEELLHNSVLACGLLPGWAHADPLVPSPDVSGIGTREGQYYRDNSDVVEHEVDGSVRIVRKRLRLQENENRPTYNGKRINPSLYCNEIIQGFENCYRVLQANAATLMAPESPLAGLLDAEVRHVPLATSVYDSLLRRAAHPDFLARSIHRELLFAILARRGVTLPSAASLLKSEMAALFDGDIPKFRASGSVTSIFDERGLEFPGFLQEDAATTIRKRLGGLTDVDLKFQKEVIRLSMKTLLRRGEPGAEMAPFFMVPSAILSDDEILNEVRLLAEGICDKAIVNGNRVDWIGLAQADFERSTFSSVGTDLYDGTAGIGLFLSYAGARLKDSKFLEAAKLCGLASLEAIRRDHSLVGGGYSGRASTAFGLLHIGAILNEQTWLDQAIDLLLKFSKDAHKDSMLDIVAGSAGICAVLLAAFRLTGDATLLDAAVRSAGHLLGKRIECGTGYGWPSRNSRAPLTGFSHGAAGIGWALVHVGHTAQQQEFILGGLKAFEYEHSVFSSTKGGWPDFREFVDEEAADAHPMAWCHGGPGIGLSRATLPSNYIGPAELLDIKNAVKSLEKSPLAATDCLCHGELGNLELFLSAANPLDRPALHTLAKRRATGAIKRYRMLGAWRCGVVPNESVPGLLSGSAGIGYGLLRCYFPGEIPSILTLAPPTKRAS